MPHNTIPVGLGGTGAEDAATARENLEITPQNIGAAPTAHTHSPSDLTSEVPVSKGGTGATTAADARTNLGLGTVATENTVPVSKGGTGATTAADARTNLGITRGNLGISYGTSTPSAKPTTGAGAVYFKIV